MRSIEMIEMENEELKVKLVGDITTSQAVNIKNKISKNEKLMEKLKVSVEMEEMKLKELVEKGKKKMEKDEEINGLREFLDANGIDYTIDNSGYPVSELSDKNVRQTVS